MKPRLQSQYENEILSKLREELGRENRLSLPRLEKIVINMGVGSAVQEKKHVEEAQQSLTALAGQKAVVTLARKSIANFRLREGMPIGVKVTLRKAQMYEFLDRLINLALPRVRDFRGIPTKSFDGRGNYSMGLTEQLVFPEVNPDKCESKPDTEVLDPSRASMQNVWSVQGCLPQVRHLPNLFAESGRPRRDSWCPQGKLVKGELFI
jgi:large subunit ribosomal protein L5